MSQNTTINSNPIIRNTFLHIKLPHSCLKALFYTHPTRSIYMYITKLIQKRNGKKVNTDLHSRPWRDNWYQEHCRRSERARGGRRTGRGCRRTRWRDTSPAARSIPPLKSTSLARTALSPLLLAEACTPLTARSVAPDRTATLPWFSLSGFRVSDDFDCVVNELSSAQVMVAKFGFDWGIEERERERERNVNTAVRIGDFLEGSLVLCVFMLLVSIFGEVFFIQIGPLPNWEGNTFVFIG